MEDTYELNTFVWYVYCLTQSFGGEKRHCLKKINQVWFIVWIRWGGAMRMERKG